MSYICTFIDWCRDEKEEVISCTATCFLWYLIGILLFGVNPFFIIIPCFLFFLQQYFYHVWLTQYVYEYYKLTSEEKQTEKLVRKLAIDMPILTFIVSDILLLFILLWIAQNSRLVILTCYFYLYNILKKFSIFSDIYSNLSVSWLYNSILAFLLFIHTISPNSVFAKGI